MGNVLSHFGAGDEWKGMPWRPWKPPSELWRDMPTFVLAEWGYRTTTLIALYHAIKTGRMKTWKAAWICGTANDIFFMFMPFCDNFWQAQASVMITPRLPLYIVEMYASVMYYPSVAAALFSRSMGLHPVAQACLTGLHAHYYYGVYDVNGPRYLWWTWHDGDPAISERHYNAPYGSSLWILTYCSLQSLINSWITKGKDVGMLEYLARLAGTSLALRNYDMAFTTGLSKVMEALPGKLAEMLKSLYPAAMGLERLQEFLGKSSDLPQIMFRALTCTPLFMTVMGQLQICSLDKIGIPGQRTYFLTLAAMIGTILHQLLKGGPRIGSKALPSKYRGLNRIFLAAVFAHFGLHTAINKWGNPLSHASTGIHQKIQQTPTTVKDICGWKREEELPPRGPHLASAGDYSFEPASGVKKPVDAIDAQPDGVQSQWYTVYGKKHKDRGAELRRGQAMAAVGLMAFSVAMRREI